MVLHRPVELARVTGHIQMESRLAWDDGLTPSRTQLSLAAPADDNAQFKSR
jgi:hypothetical protein